MKLIFFLVFGCEVELYVVCISGNTEHLVMQLIHMSALDSNQNVVRLLADAPHAVFSRG